MNMTNDKIIELWKKLAFQSYLSKLPRVFVNIKHVKHLAKISFDMKISTVGMVSIDDLTSVSPLQQFLFLAYYITSMVK